MSSYNKYNIVYHLQKWLDSVPGQTFLNYAYSWGASIVIAGTLFKLTHLPGANLMLFLGMGTEILVFFLSAFDRPFDKTAEGRDLPSHVEEAETEPDEQIAPIAPEPSVAPAPVVEAPIVQAIPANPEMADVQSQYVDQLKNLVETLGKVNEQSTRLARDSEEMENLNRTLTGISRVYEMQLKSASQQIGTLDQITEQTKMMARQIEQLNSIYTRMIDAMTANLKEK